MGQVVRLAGLLNLAVALASACDGESTPGEPTGGAGAGGTAGSGGSTSGSHSGGRAGNTAAGRGGGSGDATAGTAELGGNSGEGGVAGSTSTGGSAPATGGTTSTGGSASGRGGTAANSGGTQSAGGASGRGGTGGSAAGSGGSVAGTNGSAGSAGNHCDTPDGKVELIPDHQGFIARDDACNDVGVQGFWFPWGDAYGNGPGDARCLKVGLHSPSECAHITLPDPTQGAFSNVNGLMHTTGSVEKVLPCPAALATSGCPDHDYVNMWGAGIGLNFNVGTALDGGQIQAWDPRAFGVVGIEFEIDAIPASGLRVEFPLRLTAGEAAADQPPVTLPNATTELHSTGSPYWGAQKQGDRKYPNSPVVVGQNQVLWEDVAPPSLSAYSFDLARIIGIRFHVVAGTAAAYDFTVSHLKFLR